MGRRAVRRRSAIRNDGGTERGLGHRTRRHDRRDGAWRGGNWRLYRLPTGTKHVTGLVRLVVYKRCQPAGPWSRPETHSTRRRKMGFNDGEQGDTWRQANRRRRGSPQVSTQTAPTARRIVLEPRPRAPRKGRRQSRSSWLLRARKRQVNIALQRLPGLVHD